jgi:hypothetical protein
MLLGVAHGVSQCFDIHSTDSISHISDTKTENPSNDCQKGDDCSHCCSMSHTKVIVTNSTVIVPIPSFAFASTFHYSFNPKTIVLPTPEKPPRA